MMRKRIVFVLMILLMGTPACGQDAGQSETNVKEVSCDEMTPPEEMKSCIGEPSTRDDDWNRDNLTELCQTNCDTVEEVVIGRPMNSIRPLRNIRKVQSNFILNTVYGLETLVGVENIEVIGSKYKLFFDINSPDLVSTKGFESLRGVHAKEFNIRNNRAFTDIKGFGKLERIDAPLAIVRNEELRQISGFENLEHIKGKLKIADNPNLPRCEAVEFAESIDTITGEVIIEGNGSGSCE